MSATPKASVFGRQGTGSAFVAILKAANGPPNIPVAPVAPAGKNHSIRTTLATDTFEARVIIFALGDVRVGRGGRGSDVESLDYDLIAPVFLGHSHA